MERDNGDQEDQEEQEEQEAIPLVAGALVVLPLEVVALMVVADLVHPLLPRTPLLGDLDFGLVLQLVDSWVIGLTEDLAMVIPMEQDTVPHRLGLHHFLQALHFLLVAVVHPPEQHQGLVVLEGDKQKPIVVKNNQNKKV